MPVNQECFLSFSHPLLVNQQLQSVAHALGTGDARLYITPPHGPCPQSLQSNFPIYCIKTHILPITPHMNCLREMRQADEIMVQ